MIKNDWQLRVTQKRIKDFEDALFELERLPESEAQPWLRAVQRESLESERCFVASIGKELCRPCRSEGLS
jgi:hypothetical protein